MQFRLIENSRSSSEYVLFSWEGVASWSLLSNLESALVVT